MVNFPSLDAEKIHRNVHVMSGLQKEVFASGIMGGFLKVFRGNLNGRI
jgi:hypothetical protein